MDQESSIFTPPIPDKPGERLQWGRCQGAALGLAISRAAQAHPGLLLVIAADVAQAQTLQQQLGFFVAEDDIPVLAFPDWETLPYDVFSPLPELVSERLITLHRLQSGERGIVVVPVSTLMHRLLPPEYLNAHSLVLETGQSLEREAFRLRLEASGYHAVSQVVTHGEFAVRGSLIDLFPMGTQRPFRIDLFDDEIDSIRYFDPETQRSEEKIDAIRLLPAREFPVDQAAISRFRSQYRQQFEGDPRNSLIYSGVSEGQWPGGIEYYLPLFHEHTATLFDYLSDDALVISPAGLHERAQQFFEQVEERYEQHRHDVERPLLPPARLFLTADELVAATKAAAGIEWQVGSVDERRKGFRARFNFATHNLPALTIKPRAEQPDRLLREFLGQSAARVLFVADSAGRREHLADLLRGFHLSPHAVDGWQEFLEHSEPLCITAAPIQDGLYLAEPDIALIPEALLLGEKVQQSRRRRKPGMDTDQVVRNLAELHEGDPVVHEEHGVGRYLGLQSLDVGGMKQEFLAIEYAKGDKLFVPVSSLQLISRYTGATDEQAPLHKLGTDQWERAKRKAAKKVRDAAAELLEIYARREARSGFAFPEPGPEYAQFASEFEFEETPGQAAAIEDVIHDMISPRPMDRVVCGDVGFGKTEVAMRAAFMAVNAGKQVAVLIPTTLLAQQHFDNFSDRFAQWPVRIASLSRFKSGKEVNQVLRELESGQVDIVVGTHKILSPQIKFKNLGLVIIDEEHRFGVRHKERLKSLRAEVDILTLTATPIPRTLNMAMSGMRDLSVITTPPARRHPIKTFVQQWNDERIREACQRELQRGGQIYVLHNDVKTIEKMASDLRQLIPGAGVEFAHGQMRERELERIMRDFYHQRFSILVATTIIESGIDVPTANTIIINRADRLGLAQLHQLRGRVGRSHHRAYAYLITPPPKLLTANARKRLEALEALEDLGAGFTLATHDLEIRGAGELLGEDQSGQMHEIGFSLYTRMLEKAVQAIKSGQQPELDRPLDHGTEIDLYLPALLPEDYLPDVHIRLIQYKRIASASSRDELKELRVEMIDRFGLLPQPAKNLFDITELKLKVAPLGIRKIEAGPQGGKIHFEEQPNIDPARIIHLIQTRPKQFQMAAQDKLKFFEDLSDPDTRVAKVEALLNRLL